MKWVNPKKGTRILDMGCGNGALSRLFAKTGADVVAVDFNDAFIALAKNRSSGLAIDYRVIDATDSEQLESLIDSEKFDYVMSSMVLHDMPTIEPLIAALPSLLKTNDHLIFHPLLFLGER